MFFHCWLGPEHCGNLIIIDDGVPLDGVSVGVEPTLLHVILQVRQQVLGNNALCLIMDEHVNDLLMIKKFFFNDFKL